MAPIIPENVEVGSVGYLPSAGAPPAACLFGALPAMDYDIAGNGVAPDAKILVITQRQYLLRGAHG
jgi:hypothetical protein